MHGNPKSETSKETRAVVEIIREKIALGEEVSLTVTTGSMRPMLDSGDKIVVRGCLPERLFRGDIILYENGHLLYTHRFLYKKLRGKDNLLITKGDYSTTMDKPFSYDCFLGKVVAIEKRQRRINLQTRRWKIINWILAMFSMIEVSGKPLKRTPKDSGCP